MTKKRMTTAAWVVALNRLGAELDDLAATIHPSAWYEQLAPTREQYRKLAAQPTEDREQLGLFTERRESDDIPNTDSRTTSPGRHH